MIKASDTIQNRGKHFGIVDSGRCDAGNIAIKYDEISRITGQKIPATVFLSPCRSIHSVLIRVPKFGGLAPKMDVSHLSAARLESPGATCIGAGRFR